jgi:hypothetical protein
MKKPSLRLLCVIALILVVTGVLAVKFALPENDVKTCQEIAKLAEGIMEARQAGVPMHKLIKSTDSFFLSRKSSELVNGLTLEAYSQPVQSSPQAQRYYVTSFSNYWRDRCERDSP